MQTSDPYKILGVSENDTDETIKQAYRQLAKKYHPDANRDNPEAEARFKEITEAYEQINTSAKRDELRYRQNPFSQFTNDMFGHNTGFHDFFSSWFTSQARQNVQTIQKEIIYLSLLDVIYSKNVLRDIRVSKICSACNGTRGVQDTCPTCSGRGYINGNMICPKCGGSGFIITEKCKTCSGTGKTHSLETISIALPNGVLDGEVARYNFSPNVTNEFVFKVVPSKVFKRSGRLDIFISQPIRYEQLIAGAQIQVLTPFGYATLNIPPNTSITTSFKIKNKGVLGIGDFYVKFELDAPVNGYTEEDVALFKQISSKYEKSKKQIELEKIIEEENLVETISTKTTEGQ